MDIRVRSQSKAKLADCSGKDIMLGGKLTELNQIIIKDYVGGVEILGIYENMKRAEEVLDMIQESIEFGYRKQSTGIVINMPEN